MTSRYVFLAAILLIIAYLIFLRIRKTPNLDVSDAEAMGADRLAKLLIAEIKLFETYKVKRGLEINNLYGSLQDEIEAARKKFVWSYPNPILLTHFEDALITVLADGDRNKLGEDYILRSLIKNQSE